MKKNIWLVSLAMLSASVVAQQVTNAPPAPAISTPAPTNPETAAPATNASVTTTTVTKPKTNTPAAKSEKKKSAQKKKAEKKSSTPRKSAAAELRTVPLVAGQATVIASNVNVRGQAKLKSEVITQVQKGQTVNVLEEVTLKNSGPSEPSAWAKIILPANVHVWVNSNFVSTNHTVIPRNLSLRGGPGENYSRLGTIKRGDEIKEIGRKGDWIEIEAPAEACGYIAAQYLSQAPAPIAAIETPLTNTTVAENPPVTPAQPEPPAPSPAEPATSNAVANVTPPTPSPAETNAVEEPPPPRIVEREGRVRGTFSIQAPTRFELVSPDTGKVINYLYTTSSSLDLRRYKGMRIIVTGEEGLDERWQNTPVITIQKIVVLE